MSGMSIRRPGGATNDHQDATAGRLRTRLNLPHPAVTGALLTFCTVGVLTALHRFGHDIRGPGLIAALLRDTAVALPLGIAAAWASTCAPARHVVTWFAGGDPATAAARRVCWAAFTAPLFAAAMVASSAVQGILFGIDGGPPGFPRHALSNAGITMLTALVCLLALALAAGLRQPSSSMAWGTQHDPGPRLRRPHRALLAGFTSGALVVALSGVTGLATPAAAATTDFQCGALSGERTVVADVVSLDQPFFYNRLGAYNPQGMIYALRRDVIVKSGTNAGKSLSDLTVTGAAAEAGNVALRPTVRPRPLTLRMNVGDCLEIHFQNMLAPTRIDKDQPADRNVGVHVDGMLLVDPDGTGPLTAIDSDGSFVGKNNSSLVAPGGATVYKLYAEHENTYLMSNPGVPMGAEGNAGTQSFGLFGAVNVEPFGTTWYRSQVTRVDMNLAAAAWKYSSTTGWTPTSTAQFSSTGQMLIRGTSAGQPVINYDAVYPTDPSSPYYDPSRAGVPILRMLDGNNRIVHGDLYAIIAGPASNGFRIPHRDYPQTYWDNNVVQDFEQKGAEPFREFTAVFDDEVQAVDAFPQFADPNLKFTLHGARDKFAINYGASGIGSEVIANRLGVGPMWNCVDCKFEEFFLSSWVIGDPAQIVDIPANTTDANGNIIPGPKATKVLYPDDPSNVNHAYLNDRVKIRNLNAGPKEHHVFHLHAHQWQFTPNTKKSAYNDSQLIGPGDAYTYDSTYGGGGNRNKTVGDAIFHCHFYPHFAEGMWELWRNHDTFERGTKLDANGRPVPGARALPDGEITAGTPIPALVPLPGKAMAPMPNAATTVVPFDLNGDGVNDSSQLDNDGDGVADVVGGFTAKPANNPGFPFFIPGVAGHRAPTPALDAVDVNGDGQVEDGGLPRADVLDGTAVHYETRLDFGKILNTLRIVQLPEAGTPAEKVAMNFHAALWHPTFLTDGTQIDSNHVVTGATGRPLKGFETNGLPPQPGAPYAEPCRGDPLSSNNWAVNKVGNPRLLKVATIQLDPKFNKLGWHYPQQRMFSFWDDVGAFLNNSKAPQPLVMRIDVNDCTTEWLTNLMPNVYQLDDYQVRTPTDVIGQHIHLVKFDVTSSDGAENGYNYEDGSMSPQEVKERIDAIRTANNCAGDDHLDPGDTWTATCPLLRKHPFFGNVPEVGDLAWGARTEANRWYADPVPSGSFDEGVGTTFTHDHFSPSTHQQIGLYTTVLVEPRDSIWRDPEDGTIFGNRDDGGPTSWRADIIWPNGDSRNANAFREVFFEFADFQLAYQAGGGALRTIDNGAGVQIPTFADFKNAINPPFKQEPPAGHEKSLYFFPNFCPNNQPRPCPELITTADEGTYVVNYRNEPGGARVFDPATGTQAAGPPGDLARVFQSRTDRADPRLNVQPAFYPPLSADLAPGDPFTPMFRVYDGDRVRVRIQTGAHEEQHNVTIHGLRWTQEPLHSNSGWRDTQAIGISEYFDLDVPLMPDIGQPGTPAKADYLYETNGSKEGLWNGTWGLVRSYAKARNDLLLMPNNSAPTTTINNEADFDQSCPTSAPVRRYNVTAVRAAQVLGPQGIVYNSRTPTIKAPGGGVEGAGPLIDPTALLYVNDNDLVRDSTGKPTGLKPGTPIEPLVLRAVSGECVQVQLTNALPTPVPDMPGFDSFVPIVHSNENADGNGGILTFNANDVVPSSLVGLHPELVQYDVRTSDGQQVGQNGEQLVAPGNHTLYHWYAGDVRIVPDPAGGLMLQASPVEYGAIALAPADRLKGPEKGLIGALVIEPPGATWQTDPTSDASASVTFPATNGTALHFREFVPMLQSGVAMRYGGGCTPSDANLQCAVPGVDAEAGGVSEDAEDSGQEGINYRTDPFWFRLGIGPDTNFSDPLFNDNTDVHRLYSDALVGADPQTPVFVTSPAHPDPVRVRLVDPGGAQRGHEFEIHGNVWQREPYVQDSARISWTFQGDPTTLDQATNGLADGRNLISWFVGAQGGVGPSSHFDLVNQAAGGVTHAVGDFLYQDQTSFGRFQGLWGLLRNHTTPPMGGADSYSVPAGYSLSVSSPGVLRNDLDLDGNSFTATLLTSTQHGTLTLSSNGSFSYTPASGFSGQDSFTYADVDADGQGQPVTVTINVS